MRFNTVGFTEGRWQLYYALLIIAKTHKLYDIFAFRTFSMRIPPQNAYLSGSSIEPSKVWSFEVGNSGQRR